jgi:hypothetical protein
MPLLIRQRLLLRISVILMVIALGAALVWWLGWEEKAQDKQDVRSAEALADTQSG